METTDPAGNENGIAVFSRTPLTRTRPCPAAPEHQTRWLDVDLPEYGFGVGVLCIMAAGSSKVYPTDIAEVQFWETVFQAAGARLQEPLLFVSDGNNRGSTWTERPDRSVRRPGKQSVMAW